MEHVGVRALKQNASAVVAAAAAGTPVTITDRGRPTALLSAIPQGRLTQLLTTGRARPPRCPGGIASLPAPAVAGFHGGLSAALRELRDSERY